MSSSQLFITGLITGLGLIAAIGAQNAFVLRQGIRREYTALVVFICAASDAVLITLGYFSIKYLQDIVPKIVPWMTWAGAFYLIYIGIQSLLSLKNDNALKVSHPDTPNVERRKVRSIAITALALTWLNPHVYLDTVILLGSIAHRYDNGYIFSIGAFSGSVMWFSSLGFAAVKLAPALSSPRAWKTIDVFVALTMFVVAGSLIASIF